jgi:hypothetical protein
LSGFLKWYGSDCDSFVKDAKANPTAIELKPIKFMQEKKILVESKQRL